MAWFYITQIGEAVLDLYYGQVRNDNKKKLSKNNLYWVIRNQGRNKTKRRMYYRLVAKEKLRLAENNIDQDLINATCRYLADFKIVHGLKMYSLIQSPKPQQPLQF